MNSKPLLFGLALAWLLSFAVAFFLGRTSTPVQTVEVPGTGETKTVYVPVAGADGERAAIAATAATAGTDGPPIATSATSSDPTDLPPPTRIEYVERPPTAITRGNVSRVLEDNDPVARMTALTDMLRDLTPESAAVMVESFDNMPEGFDRGWEKNLLLHAWAKIDGPGAIEYASNNRRGGWGGQMSAYSVLSGWATTDPAAAEEWARAKTDNKDNGYLVGVIHGVARNNLQAATDLTYDLPYGRNRGRAVDALVNGYFQKGSAAAANWARNLPGEDERLKAGITTRVVGKLAKSDPLTSADLAMSLPAGESRQNAIEEVADEWSEEDPARTARWVDNIEDNKLRSEAMTEVVGNWARKDAEQTAAWLNSYERTPAMDKPFERFARSIAGENPESAMIWANQISDDKRREDALGRLANDWLKRDPEAARAFLGQ